MNYSVTYGNLSKTIVAENIREACSSLVKVAETIENEQYEVTEIYYGVEELENGGIKEANDSSAIVSFLSLANDGRVHLPINITVTSC